MGTVAVNGFDVATQPAQVRECFSLTGQFAAVDEILSGRENLVLIAEPRHLADPGEIADRLLEIQFRPRMQASAGCRSTPVGCADASTSP